MRIALAGLVLAATAAEAARPAAAQPSVSAALGFETRYLFRGVQFAGSSFQPAVTVGYQGLYLTGWANLPVGDEDLSSFGGEEIDVVAGYSAPLSDLVTIDVGVTYYTFPNLDAGFFDIYEEDGDGLGANTLEPYLGFAFKAPLSPKIYLYRDFMFDTFTAQGALAHSVPLAGAFSLDLSGIVGYVFDDDPGNDYLYGHATANVSHPLSDSAAFYVGARFGGSDIAGGSVFDDASLGTTKSNGFWFGMGLSASF